MSIVNRLTKPSILVAGLLLIGAAGIPAAGQENLRAERTVRFRTNEPQSLGTPLGPVKIGSVRFSDLGHPPTLPFGLTGRSPELLSIVRSAIEVENPNREQWEVKFTFEFLDRDGKTIDRVEKTGEFEREAKTYQIDHDLLSYVVPLIDRVRVKMEAKLD